MTPVPKLARIVACLLTLALAGCNGTLEPLDAGLPAQRTGNVQAVPVAFVALEGAPETIQTRFVDQLAQEALGRQLRPVEAESARYFIRGYLSAIPVEGPATRFTYVWDVFDASRRRIQRVEDEITLSRRAADPWSLADEALLASLASKSAEDLAGLIAMLPEALASSPATAPVQSALLAQ